MRLIAQVVSLVMVIVAPAVVRAEAVSFRNDVMAVLTRAGCNQGTCHGNQNGKNGFKLSLRGENPEFDLAALTRDTQGRRVNLTDPVKSLILLKPTAQAAHGGGKRFDVESRPYEILYQWIVAGCRPDGPEVPTVDRIEVSPFQKVLIEPADSVQIQVQAYYSDGSSRDVTELCLFEPGNQVVSVTPTGQVQRNQMGESSVLVTHLNQQATVRLAFVPARPDFAWPDVPEHNFIDRHIYAKLRMLRMRPSELADDRTFLRRAYLDALGILPTPDEVREFLADDRPDKRSQLIDRLLQRPEFADSWALKWADVLRNEEHVLDRKGVQTFHHWIRQWILEGKPLNEFARELLTARGSTYRNPPTNFYRALRNPFVRAESVAQVFLGVRIQCAHCHNHPFDRWTQTDYFGLASFFAPIEYKIITNNPFDQFDASEFNGEQVVWLARESTLTNPQTDQPAEPRFLGSETSTPDPEAQSLEALAEWVADPANPFFARAQVNRIWYHLMGRGIVDPIDDFRASNPPVNEPLLDALSREFIDSGFHLRHMVRLIMNSRTYQLSAEPNDTNRDDEVNFSRALVQPLQAEQLLDALSRVLDAPAKFNGYPLGMRAMEIPGVRAFHRADRKPSEAEQFLMLFGKPERHLTCECERSEENTLIQAFHLITGPLVNQMLTAPDNRIGQLLSSGKSDKEIVEELYLAALSRYPTDEEQRTAASYIAQSSDRRAALEDITWALLNAKGFLLRH